MYAYFVFCGQLLLMHFFHESADVVLALEDDHPAVGRPDP